MSKYIYHKKSTNICEFGCKQDAHYQILTSWNAKNLRWCCSIKKSICPNVVRKKATYHKKSTNICEFGCNKKAFWKLVNQKWCCSSSSNSCDGVKENKKQAWIKLYGVSHHAKTEKSKIKTRKTNMKRWGGPAPACSEIISDKMKNTKQERYGKETFNNRPKAKETCQKRYGGPSPIHSKEIRSLMVKTRFENLFDNFDLRNENKLTPLFLKDEYTGSGKLYLWRCNKCENEFKDYVRHGVIPRCTTCYPKFANSSMEEKEIVEFINELGFRTQENSKSLISPKELDIYIPSKQIAIEYHGLYWHSEEFKSKNYHFEKYEACKDKGIRLIQIFGDEWIHKQDQVESRLKHILGLQERKCGARETIIREISSSESKEFLILNHIQGPVNSKIKLGAFYQNELVAVMTFGGLRKSMGSKAEEGTYELLRFCSYQIPGVAGKLFKHFLKSYNPLEVISYCDLRWGTGNLYEQLGFDFSHISAPNYFYLINNKREPRFKYRKDVLVKEGFDPNLTEREIMQERKIHRIYDCGNKKFIWRKNESI